jgi:hypothetical protein
LHCGELCEAHHTDRLDDPLLCASQSFPVVQSEEAMMELHDDVSPSIYRFPELVRYTAARLRRRLRQQWEMALLRRDAKAQPVTDLSGPTPTQIVLGAWCLAIVIALGAFGLTLML